MKIPLPCKFGELSDCDGKLLPLCGVHWFDWMSGRQYTYFFETGDQWHPYTFYETRQEQQPFSMEIPDDLLSNDFNVYTDKGPYMVPYFAAKNGEIIPLDGDIYELNEEVIESEEWTMSEEEIQNGLTIVVIGGLIRK